MAVKEKFLDLIREISGRNRKEEATSKVDQMMEKLPSHLSFMAGGGLTSISEFLQIEDDLKSRFMDYEDMDDLPELSSALDIYSDDSTQANTMTNKSIWVEGENQGLVDDMEEMLHKRINIDEEIWGLSRNLNKYGGDFEELLVKEGEGVVGLNFLPTPLVRAVVDKTWRVIGYKYHPQGKFTQTTEEDFNSMVKGTRQSAIGEVLFEDWNVAHFKLGSRKRYDIYGSSVLESARWIWRRLILLEDSMLVYRLTRAAARFIFYIDVGDRPPQDAYNYVTKVKTDFKKKKFVNRSGHLDMRYNPLANDEDMFIATRSGKRSAEVETLQGPIYGAIDDVEYFKDKLYAAIKIPKAYLGFESDISAKALLSQEDIRFSRTVLRIQREIRNGVKQICKVHLAAKGIDPFDVDYDVMMTVPSAIFEQSYLETLKVRAEVADKLQSFITMPWILKNIFHFSDAEVFEMEQMKNKVDQTSGQTLDLSRVPAGAGIEVPIPEGADINQQILLAIKNSGVSPKQFLSDRISLGVAQDKLDKALARSYGEKGSSDKLLDKMNAMEKGQGGMSKKLKELGSLLGELKHAMHKSSKSA